MYVFLLKWVLRCSSVYIRREVSFAIFLWFFFFVTEVDTQIRLTCDHPDELRRKEVIYMKYEKHQCVMT